MKRLLVWAIFLASCADRNSRITETNSKDSASNQLGGVWWNMGEGTIDGLQLDPDSTLRFPGIHTMAGRSWHRSKDTLVLTTIHLKFGYIDTTRYLIRTLDNKQLRLSLTPGDTAFSILYQRISIDRNTDRFQGRWTGVEGNYLDVIPSKKNYRITVHNQNNPEGKGRFMEYMARSSGNELQFTSGKETIRIRTTDGKGSGMKYLSDKSDCIVLDKGDGYCRD